MVETFTISKQDSKNKTIVNNNNIGLDSLRGRQPMPLNFDHVCAPNQKKMRFFENTGIVKLEFRYLEWISAKICKRKTLTIHK